MVIVTKMCSGPSTFSLCAEKKKVKEHEGESGMENMAGIVCIASCLGNVLYSYGLDRLKFVLSSDFKSSMIIRDSFLKWLYFVLILADF